jgi:serine/threonine protein kinase
MYSVGAIIIELVTGQKGIPRNTNNVLRRWRHSWNKTTKETPLEYHHQVTECIEIGKLCLDLDPHTRPSISQVMTKFVEMESTKINPSHWEDDMLGVEPLELRFGFNEHILSCSVELSNDTDVYIAFNIETTSPLPYSIEPNKDIVKPRSKFSVDIKLPFASIKDYKAALQCRSSNERYSKELIVQSFKANEGLTTKDINKIMFDKHTEGQHVDEIHLVVVSEEESYSEEVPLLSHFIECRFFLCPAFLVVI